MTGGHSGSNGPKIRYKSQADAEAALRRRLDEGVRHDGRPWAVLAVYQCRKCHDWHLTSAAMKRSPNFLSGGWARSYLVEDLELGTRASMHLRLENRAGRPKIVGLAAVRRKVRQRAAMTKVA